MTDRNTISQVIESLFEDWIDKNINVHPLAVENMRILEADALALLKEQETELSYRDAKTITHTATKLDDATCPSCGNVVGEKIRTGAIGQSVVRVRWDYCRFCGQKLDWEGR